MTRAHFFNSDTLGVSILVALTIAGVFCVYWGSQEARAQGGGTYYWIREPESDSDENFGETFAPCRDQSTCNFSCNAGNVGRSCWSLDCTGSGNGDAAYFHTSTYTCAYEPPAQTTCTPTNCAPGTCSTDTCVNTLSDCSTQTVAGTMNCAVSCTVSNSCGAENSGTMVNGVCSATPPALPSGYGNSCSVSNSCGSQTNYGTIQCDSSCSASAPSEAGCSCVGNVGASCNVNACGVAGGTVQCDGSCSGGTPALVDQCPMDPGTQCSVGECSAGDPGDPTPTANLTANPTSIVLGGSSTLTWSSSDATSCIGGGFSTGNATSGARSVSPSSTQTYTLNCTGPGGGATDDATVTVTGGACSGAGPLTATATPSRLSPGDSTVLTWLGSNVASASCTVTNLNTGSTIGNSAVTSCSTTGSASVSSLPGQTTFRITCGALTRDVTVNLVPTYEEF